MQMSEIRYLLADPHLRVEAPLFRHVADAPPDLEVDRGACPHDLTLIGYQNA
jgi:hypothetical protein